MLYDPVYLVVLQLIIRVPYVNIFFKCCFVLPGLEHSPGPQPPHSYATKAHKEHFQGCRCSYRCNCLGGAPGWTFAPGPMSYAPAHACFKGTQLARRIKSTLVGVDFCVQIVFCGPAAENLQSLQTYPESAHALTKKHQIIGCIESSRKQKKVAEQAAYLAAC